MATGPATPRRPLRGALVPPTVQRSRARRVLVIACLGGVAFLAGIVAGARHESPSANAAQAYVAAWARADYAAMYARLTPADRTRYGRSAFAQAHTEALAIATAQRVVPGAPRRDGDVYRVPMTITTRIFGVVRGEVVLPVSDDGIDWQRSLVFPGLRPGEELRRDTRLPQRATILARDNTPLATGAARSSAQPSLTAAVVGQLGAIPAGRRAALERLGVPADAEVGISGLERIFDERLIGRPGGSLLAGGRVIASSTPRKAPAVRSTISLPVLQSAVAALAGRVGGVVALSPRSGQVLAFAGIAFSGLQPPGSTFKIITATGALEARITSPSRTYPVATKAVLDGVDLENANGEACGGTFLNAFAQSCNSVFAPLGARLGAKRLVAVAERFGFNTATDIAGAAVSTIPAANRIQGDLALGSTAIGQGQVQATALQMASVAATIGLGGRRPRLTLDLAEGRRPLRTTRVTAPAVARTMEKLMRQVVLSGTGTLAAVPGVPVAGKTGTAELKTTVRCEPDAPVTDGCVAPGVDDPSDTDAWFAAYAPSSGSRPRIAVGVMLVGAGAGGETAAPAARQVLTAGLQATG